VLALARGRDDRPVDVDPGGLVGERWSLLRPDLAAADVEGSLQRLDERLVEASAEVTGRRRIGDRLHAERVEVHLVVAQPLDVSSTRPPQRML